MGRPVGVPAIGAVLSNLGRFYGEDRYRVSPLIQQRVFAGKASMTDVQPVPTDPRPWPKPSPRRCGRATAPPTRARHRIESVGPGRATVRMTVRRRHGEWPPHLPRRPHLHLADTAFAYACNSYNKNTVASACNIDFVATGREGDTLDWPKPSERSQSGRTGVYDVTVRASTGKTIALFGASYRINGEVIAEGLTPRTDLNPRQRGDHHARENPSPEDLDPIETASRDEISACSSNACSGRSATPTTTSPLPQALRGKGVHPDDLKPLWPISASSRS